MAKIKKVVLLGDGAVGKTSLVNSYVESTFSDEYIRTVGTVVKKKDLGDVVLQLWDIFGQKTQYNKMTHQANYRGAEAAILVYDFTREETFTNLLEKWIPDLYTIVPGIPIILFGNKSDLADRLNKLKKRNTLHHMAEDAKTEKNYNIIGHYITSAKTGENIEDGFGNVADILRGV